MRWLPLILLVFSTNRLAGQLLRNKIFVKVKDTWQVNLRPYDYSWSAINKAFIRYGVDVANIEQPFADTTYSKKLSKIYRLTLTDTQRIDSLVNALNGVLSIEYAERISTANIHYNPGDIQSQQWHLDKIQARMAWDFGKGSSSVKVAVIDNGVLIDHEDLKNNIWVNAGETPNNGLDDDKNGYIDDVRGYDMADNDNNPNPPGGLGDSSAFCHGTYVAGICAATTENGKGIASLGFRTNIIPIKCSGDTSNGKTLTSIADGIYYAMKCRADVINIAAGFSVYSETIQALLQVANSKGTVVVASAGNDAKKEKQYPAANAYVIAVGATDPQDKVAAFSNFGEYVDVMAPGTDIYSTLASSTSAYGTWSGTSGAAPLVSGLLALLKASNKNFTPEQMELAIKKGCENIDGKNPAYIGMMGAGRINAYRTVNPGAADIMSITTVNPIVEVFPNPATGLITIKNNSKELSFQKLVVLQATGRKVDEVLLNPEQLSNGFVYSLAALNAGVYWFCFSNAERQYIRTVIVQ